MDTPDTSIRRAPRTYGRRKIPEAPDLDTSFAAESSASSTRSSPAFSESSPDVPPTSDFETSFNHGDDDVDDDVDVRVNLSHRLGWKRRMDEMEKNWEEEMGDVQAPRKMRSSGSDEGPSSSEERPRRTHGISAGDDGRLGDDADSSSVLPFQRRSIWDDLAQIDKEYDNVQEEARDNPALSSGNVTLDDRLGGPSSRPTGDTESIHDRRSPRSKSPSSSPSPRARRLAKRRTVVPTSDSEGERAALRSSSPQTSPGALHHIGTPKIASSPTPPTTQELESKGKGKAKARSKASDGAESDELPVMKATKKTRNKGADKDKRVKAPSRKERLETEKTTARIKADQDVSLQRSHGTYTATTFWGKVQLPKEPDPVADGPSSDPIQPFSSPIRPRASSSAQPRQVALRPQLRARSGTVQPLALFPTSNRLTAPHARRASGSGTQNDEPQQLEPTFVATGLLEDLPAAESSDEDMDMPDVGTLVEEANRKRAKKKAWEMKIKALAEQKLATMEDDDSDLEVVDNMHVVANEEEKDRRIAKSKHLRPSLGRKNQLALAGRSGVRSPTKDSPLRNKGRDLYALAAAAAPSFGIGARSETRKGKERAVSKVGRAELNRTLLDASGKQSRELTLQKEREFYKNRELPSESRPDDTEVREMKQQRLNEIIARGIEVAQRRERSQEDDYEDEPEEDGSDRDWMPQEERSGSEKEEEMEEEENDENDENTAPPQALPTTEDEDDENVRPIPRRSVMNRQILDSDEEEEDDENRSPSARLQSYGRVLVQDSSLVLDDPFSAPMLNHRPSLSSMEGGTDKENDQPAVENKENTPVPSPFTLSSVRVPRRTDSAFTLSSPSQPRPLGNVGERAPFTDLPLDEADVPLDSPTRPPVGLGIVRATTPETPTRARGRNLSPIILRNSATGAGNALGAYFQSTLSPARSGPSTPAGPSSLQPAANITPGRALEGYFESSARASRSGTPKAPKDDLADLFASSAKATPTLRSARAAGKAKADELDLSLGSMAQPSLQVNQSLVRKADDIFEKEQGQVVEAVIAESKPTEEPMFINSYGFLTQTAHLMQTQAGALESPSVLLTSPMFNESARKPVARQPLAARRLPSPEEETPSRPRRLHRRPTSPDDDDDDVFGPSGGYRSSPSPSPVKRSAFDVLGKGKIAALKLPKKKLGKSMYVEGEAEESDEDAGYGFGLVRKKDDEEELDGDEQDQILEELVDDAKMDDDTLNEEKVLEKVQEHRALDDAADEKIARDAAEGKLRMKRRNGQIDFEDEDSDEEDYDAKRRRQRMAKKRRIDGDSLEKLANNPETQAFVEAYRAEMEDDNEEFAHLEREDETFMVETTPDRDEEDDEDEEPREMVTTMQLQEELRRVARGEQTVETIDTNDVTWLDADGDEEMDENIRIKEVVKPSRGPGVRNAAEMEWELLQPRREDSASDMARHQKWARSEGGARNNGTGRASAVTGHAKSTKLGSGSINGRRNDQTRDKPGAKPLAKAPSALSAVSSRRARFG